MLWLYDAVHDPNTQLTDFSVGEKQRFFRPRVVSVQVPSDGGPVGASVLGCMHGLHVGVF